MDQRPGQHIDLGLYFHMEGPVSPKIRLTNRFLPGQSEKHIFESSTKCRWLGLRSHLRSMLSKKAGFLKNIGTYVCRLLLNLAGNGSKREIVGSY